MDRMRGLLTRRQSDEEDDMKATPTRITIVGAGEVGMACAFSCLTQGITNDLCMIDVNQEKLKGEVMDLQHGSLFLSNPRITAAEDYSETKDSRVCIVTAGARQRQGETRMALINRNVEIFKQIIPRLVENSPDAILIIVSNPVDVLTYISWKLSGLPKNRVLGSGTNLDSSRFRFQLSQRLNVATKNVHGWIIGEHGDSSVAVWSGVNVAGVRLKELNSKIGTEEDPDKWHLHHKEVINSAYEIIRLKGYTSWAIGLSVSQICQAIIRDQHSIHAVSTLLEGVEGVKEEVFASLPCIIGTYGVTSIIQLRLDPNESEAFNKSVDNILRVQNQVHLNLSTTS